MTKALKSKRAMNPLTFLRAQTEPDRKKVASKGACRRKGRRRKDEE